MKKIKWYLLLAAIAGIGAAYTNKPKRFQVMHTYSFSFYNVDYSRMYYGMDLTDAGYRKGIDYDCVTPINVCTFIADPDRAHSDLTGMYFYTSDVPSSGIDDSGSFEMF